MSQRVRIKDVAKLAGVSAGTVDRIIHKRGNVSEKKRLLVEEILEKLNYKPNLHLSSISAHKNYKIIITIPTCAKGEYWEYIKDGIIFAVKKYDLINVSYDFFYYDQFNTYSCKEVYQRVLEASPDGVIIGSTFNDITTTLVAELAVRNIPYVYVDSMVENTKPLAYFSSDQYSCGYLIGKLIDSMTPEGTEFALFQTKRVGDKSANTTILRKRGFLDFFEQKDKLSKIHNVNFSVVNPDENEMLIGRFFESNPNVRGAVVLSSRGYIVANYFKENNVNDVKLICVDLTDNNYQEIMSGNIEFVVAQRPFHQGYLATEKMIGYFIYKNNDVAIDNFMPIDILTKENVELYRKNMYSQLTLL